MEIKTKYNIGDEVYHFDNEESCIKKTVIRAIIIKSVLISDSIETTTTYMIKDKDNPILEEWLFGDLKECQDKVASYFKDIVIKVREYKE